MTLGGVKNLNGTWLLWTRNPTAFKWRQVERKLQDNTASQCNVRCVSGEDVHELRPPGGPPAEAWATPECLGWGVSHPPLLTSIWDTNGRSQKTCHLAPIHLEGALIRPSGSNLFKPSWQMYFRQETDMYQPEHECSSLQNRVWHLT